MKIKTVVAAIGVAFVMALVGCGGNVNPGSPPPTTAVVVSATTLAPDAEACRDIQQLVRVDPIDLPPVYGIARAA